MDKEQLNSVIEKHHRWLNNEEGGERADLRSANLSSANLSSADLRYADLRSANLRYADLRSANLRYADLSSADLRSANLSSADLSSANLSSANLRSADLSSADLRSATGNMKEIKSIFIEQYPIAYTYDYLQVGCERHPIIDWWDFTDKRILEMDGKTALKFWRKWKSHIQEAIDLSPATKSEPME